MKIARVFPTRTSMSPTDKDAYFGLPDLFTPQYDEVHISVTFTWDLPKIKLLKDNWERYGKVEIGGPAFNDRGGIFQSGLYLKKGVIITSRGCPNKCSWCFVPKREGKIRELPIVEGNVIQDNNLLACSKSHCNKVFAMLKNQKRIDFPGGLEASRITDEIVEQLRGLRIYQLWLAFDHPNQEKILRKAVKKLAKYFYKEIVNDQGKVIRKEPNRDKIRCYVLVGYEGDTLEKAEQRLQKAWEIGTLPFAMRYRTPEPQWQGTYLFNERKWNLFTREWSRPAIIKSKMKESSLF